MRVAAIYDIHGNLPALDAVLDDIHRAGVDRIVVGGDVVPGPMPHETIARLRGLDLPVHFIKGNGDREVLARRRGMDTGTVPAKFREVIDWVAAELTPEDEAMLATWPATLRLEITGIGRVLFCHATPHSDTEIFTKLTPDHRLAPIFAGVDADLVVCGHTHMQFDRRVGDVRVMNAGSVGMPFGAPGAYWLLLGPDAQLQYTPYDLDRAADQIRASRYPHADEFATGNVLQPPTEELMLKMFAR